MVARVRRSLSTAEDWALHYQPDGEWLHRTPLPGRGRRTSVTRMAEVQRGLPPTAPQGWGRGRGGDSISAACVSHHTDAQLGAVAAPPSVAGVLVSASVGRTSCAQAAPDSDLTFLAGRRSVTEATGARAARAAKVFPPSPPLT